VHFLFLKIAKISSSEMPKKKQTNKTKQNTKNRKQPKQKTKTKTKKKILGLEGVL